MPFFKFKSKKEKEVPKRASSMNNIYNDYSGVTRVEGGATKKDVENVDQIEKYNGKLLFNKKMKNSLQCSDLCRVFKLIRKSYCIVCYDIGIQNILNL